MAWVKVPVIEAPVLVMLVTSPLLTSLKKTLYGTVMLLGCEGGKKTLAMRRLRARKMPRGSRNWTDLQCVGRRCWFPLGPVEELGLPPP
jgi:hypothetical protein